MTLFLLSRSPKSTSALCSSEGVISHLCAWCRVVLKTWNVASVMEYSETLLIRKPCLFHKTEKMCCHFEWLVNDQLIWIQKSCRLSNNKLKKYFAILIDSLMVKSESGSLAFCAKMNRKNMLLFILIHSWWNPFLEILTFTHNWTRKICCYFDWLINDEIWIGVLKLVRESVVTPTDTSVSQEKWQHEQLWSPLFLSKSLFSDQLIFILANKLKNNVSILTGFHCTDFPL